MIYQEKCVLGTRPPVRVLSAMGRMFRVRSLTYLRDCRWQGPGLGAYGTPPQGVTRPRPRLPGPRASPAALQHPSHHQCPCAAGTVTIITSVPLLRVRLAESGVTVALTQIIMIMIIMSHDDGMPRATGSGTGNLSPGPWSLSLGQPTGGWPRHCAKADPAATALSRRCQPHPESWVTAI